MKVDVEVNKAYRFFHTRKGVFVGLVIDIIHAPNEEDLIRVKIDTRRGTGQEHIARSKGGAVTMVDLRPSLITRYEDVEVAAWLREQRVKQKDEKQIFERELKSMVQTVIEEANNKNKKTSFWDNLFHRKH